MKKAILISLIISFGFINSFSQNLINKEKKIYDGKNEVIVEFSTFNGNELVKTSVLFIARNSRYTHITDYFEIIKDSPEKVISFFDFALNFIEGQEAGTSTMYEAIYLEVKQPMKKKYLTMSVDNDYCNFSAKDIKMFVDALKNYYQPEG